MALEQALFNHITDFLVPYVPDLEARRTLVLPALGYLPVIKQIVWEGNAHNFAVHLVRTLDQWGDKTLELLLNQLSSNVGLDHQKTIQDLIVQIRSATQTGQWEGSPFPGLQAFQERHEPIFFGREQEIYRLAEIVRQKPLVAVIGASGSGKSSLIQAGVIPRLKQSREETWHILRFTPDQAGVKHPFASLRSALEQHWQTDLPSPDELAEQPALLKEICQRWMNVSQHLLLLVDQFEETFTTIASTLRTPFIQALCALLDLPHIHIVLTLRSDFSEQAVNEPDLVDRLTPFLLSRPQPWALHQMIAGPAKAAGITLQGDLVETILSDTGSEPGNLALLAYTLDELYKIADARHERTIRMEDYTALGGVQGAIGKRAEKAFESLKLDNKEVLLAHVFRDLVEVDDRGTATRKRVALEHIPAEEKKLITAFTKARLLVSDEGWVEVAHEALFRSWERLKAWIATAQEDLILLRQVQNAAYHWDRTGRPDYLLWPDERLTQVYAMQNRLHPNLSEIEQAFLASEIERLLEEFRGDEREHHRLWIVDRWGKIGERAVPTLITAIEIYEEMDDLRSVLYAIAEKLRPYQHKAIPNLINYLSHCEAFVREQSAFVLGEIGSKQALPALIAAIEQAEEYYEAGEYDWYDLLRTTIVQSLAKLKDKRAVPILLKLLRDKDYLFGEVAYALGFIGDIHSVPVLIKALADVSRLETQMQKLEFGPIVRVLGKLGDRRAVLPMLKILNDRRYDRDIVAALGELGDDRATSTLLDVLRDSDRYVRKDVVEVLGKLRDNRAVPALTNLLQDENTSILQTVAVALVRIGDRKGLMALRSNPKVVPSLVNNLINEVRNDDILLQTLEAIGTPEALEAINQWRQEHPEADDTDPSP